jgi:hypothetical protein
MHGNNIVRASRPLSTRMTHSFQSPYIRPQMQKRIMSPKSSYCSSLTTSQCLFDYIDNYTHSLLTPFTIKSPTDSMDRRIKPQPP